MSLCAFLFVFVIYRSWMLHWHMKDGWLVMLDSAREPWIEKRGSKGTPVSRMNVLSKYLTSKYLEEYRPKYK